MTILRNSFFRWCTLSLVGHLILFELFGAVPLFVWALITMYQERTLTAGTAIKMGLLAAVLVGIAAALVWYSYSSQVIKGRNNRR